MKQALVAVNGIDSVEVLVAHASNWTVRVRLKAVGDAASLLGAGNIRARWVDVVPSDLAILAVERDDEHANAVIVRIASDVPRTRAARMEIELTAIAGLVGDQGRIQFLVRTAPIAGAASEGSDSAAVPLIEIDYLAKDYTSFRQTFFDVLSQRIPAWTERHAADELVAVAEVLAYSADYLSAYQDAVATEAYLTTARLRTSVRRHARFLDYRLLEGCASRVLLAFEVNEDPVGINAGMRVTGKVADASDPSPYISARFMSADAQIFETLEPAVLYVALNRMEIQADADRAIQVLPAGSTRAILRGAYPMLRNGALLVLEEEARGRRHAVRLSADPLLVTIGASEIGTRITWHDADATPFDLIVAARDEGGKQRNDVTVVRANIVPAQQGTPVTDEVFTFQPQMSSARLRAGNLLCAVPYDAQVQSALPATALFALDPAAALPQIILRGREPGSVYADIWRVRRDLLESSPFARHFVVEIENDRTVTLRFGDDVHGRRPVSGTEFHPEFHVGAGEGSEVGADVLGSIILDDHTGPDQRIMRVRNPLPASGGVDPEDLESARRDAPGSLSPAATLRYSRRLRDRGEERRPRRQRDHGEMVEWKQSRYLRLRASSRPWRDKRPSCTTCNQSLRVDGRGRSARATCSNVRSNFLADARYHRPVTRERQRRQGRTGRARAVHHRFALHVWTACLRKPTHRGGHGRQRRAGREYRKPRAVRNAGLRDRDQSGRDQAARDCTAR